MRRTPLPRSSNGLPRTPLARVSPRRKAEEADRAGVVAFVHRRDRTCRALALVDGHRCDGRLDVHEIVPRSKWRAGYLDETNCLLLCRAAHDWVHGHTREARTLGLYADRSER